MGWLIFTIIAVIFVALAFIIGNSARKERDKLKLERAAKNTNNATFEERQELDDGISFTSAVYVTTRVVIGLLVLVLFLYTLVSSIHKVDAGHVGVVYEFGAIVDQTGDGLVFTAPWQDLKNANVQEQSHTFNDDNGNNHFGLAAGSLETQDVYMVVALNYRVSPRAVQELYREVGTDYFARLVTPRINQIVKDEVVQYPAVQVTQKRDEIRTAVEDRLRAELQPYSVEIVALQIVNIDYSDEFNNSIEAKQVAAQDALREQERIKQAQAEAQQAIERARGEGQAALERATGQAEANTTLSASLTPQLIQYEALQRLGDNVRIALIPSGQGLIIDPATILQEPEE